MPTNILMPALSPTMEEGKLSKWLVKEGQSVKSGDILAEIETDKATMEFEAVDEGRIGKILVPEGSEGVKVNTPIAVLLAEGEKAGATPAPAAAKPADTKPDAIAAAMKDISAAVKANVGNDNARSVPLTQSGASGKSAASSPLSPQGGEGSARSAQGEGDRSPSARTAANDHPARIFASPLARRLAAEKGIDLAALSGSGPRGRIVKLDVDQAKPGTQKAAPQPAAAPQGAVSGVAPLPDARLYYKPEDYEAVPHDSMRKAIAKRLTSAKSLIPHYYLSIDCRLDGVLATRARLNDAGKNAYKLSVNDFVIKASAMALIKHPDVNASWTDDAILRHRHADVGVAVALDFGLITPIIFRAEEKGLAEISNEVKALAARAKDKKLKPNEYEGGGFSVSNLGMFGIASFTAVINPPQAAILAVGAGESRAIVVDGKVEAATMMSCTLSCDHRVIDGATGARFLQTFKQFIEEPASMLL